MGGICQSYVTVVGVMYSVARILGDTPGNKI